MRPGLWRVNGRIIFYGDTNASWGTRVPVSSGDIVLIYKLREAHHLLDRPSWDGIARGRHVIVPEFVSILLTWLPCDGMESFSL